MEMRLLLTVPKCGADRLLHAGLGGSTAYMQWLLACFLMGRRNAYARRTPYLYLHLP